MNRVAPSSTASTLAALAAAWLTAGALGAAGEESFPDPFEDARLVPTEVTQYYSFVDAGECLADLLDSPLAPGLRALYERSSSGRSWTGLAASAGFEPRALFDVLLSKRVTLVTDQPEPRREVRPPRRRDAPGGPPPVAGESPPAAREDAQFSRWVLMAKVDETSALDLLKRLDGRTREFIDDTPVYTAGPDAMRFAYREGRFYLAAADAGPLLTLLLRTTLETSLADDEDFREAQRVGPGDFGMFRRGAEDGRWEAAAARLRRSRLQINFLRSHDPRPINSDQADSINVALLHALGEQALYVGMERVPEAGAIPCEKTAGAGMLALVPLARARPAMLEHLGPTMFTVVEPVSSSPGGTPAITVGLEMRAPEQAVAELDAFMAEATTRLARPNRAETPANGPVTNSGSSPEVLRTVAWRGMGMPLRLVGVEENWPSRIVWSSLITADRAWWVASTDPVHQSKVIERLRTFDGPCRKSSSTSHARGVLYGKRAADLIRQWPAVTSDATHPFLGQLFAWRELLDGVSTVAWRVSRPADHRTETAVTVAWR